ncbi:hypothetical protein ACFSJ3_06780 [Corallincola platygyrae]|uniref:Solute-binding protein family 3/N-terminal domain-containing protein n=1 Tax=Corallincola platygyrae TaxID=1193278 RepID=A0ABW4XMZ5_9GAMM
MRRWLIGLFSVVLSSALSAQTIVWITDDQRDEVALTSHEPFSIGVDTVKLVMKSLPQYHFDIRVASVSGIDKELFTNPNACVANRLKNSERQSRNYFSQPLNLHLGPRLYFLKNRTVIPPQLIDANGKLTSIHLLLSQKPRVVLGLASDASYGKRWDAELHKATKEGISMFSVDNRYDTNAMLLSNQMVDLIVDYPTQIKHQIAQHNLSESEIESISLAGAPEFLVTYIACSKSEIGAKFIEDVNQTLSNLYETNDFLKAHTLHIDQSTVPAFKTNLNQVLKEQKN